MFRRRLLLLGGVTAAVVLLGAIVFAVIRITSSSAGVPKQGDVDCDQVIDSVDALLLLRQAAGISTQVPCATSGGDVNCDGKITSVDALHVLRYAAGLPSMTPAGCTPVGSPLGSATPTGATPMTVTPTAGPSSTPGLTCVPAPSGITPSGTPAENGYHLTDTISEANFDGMVDLVMIPGTTNQAIVVRQNGVITRIATDGSFAPADYGDLSSKLTAGGEQGLLSVAFSPDFAHDSRIYAYYTRGSPNPSVLARYQVFGGSIDISSETVILTVPQPYANHNGGRIVFGPDCYLYLSLGDGGSGGDPQNNGQSLNTFLGKILRINVTGQAAYTIPPDNPFIDGVGPNKDEIFAYGLRNPWRFSFDRLTGRLWAGDVGQSNWEEVDRVIRGGNYGWRCYEGFEAYNLSAGCPDQSQLQFPRVAYPNQNTDNQAVTGGYVYRGASMPELYGWYIYGDAYSGRIWAVNTTDETSAPVQLVDTDRFISSFAETPDGEILLVTFNNAVYRLARN
ncbi:MAG: glucose sorbosone dehydrogenase [Chloroflexi bacterium]|nr:MAG: glucose sorbosone dehydrogenase [Chloroflexota bacterium]